MDKKEKIKKEMTDWNNRQQKFMDEHDGKGFITVSLEHWLKNATPEEIQKFCDDGNAFASLQREVYKNS